MKTPALAIFATLFFMAVPALARQTKTIEITYQSFHSYYSCSGAEDDVHELLSKLGAEKIETSCSGGLEMHAPYVSVNATFSAADSNDADASWQTIKINTTNGCQFDKLALNQILPAFQTKDVQVSGTCFEDFDNGIRATLTVWK